MQPEVAGRRGAYPLHIPLGGHIEHTPGGDAEAGDHRQRHKAQGHERVDAVGHAQRVGGGLGGLQIPRTYPARILRSFEIRKPSWSLLTLSTNLFTQKASPVKFSR